MKNAFKQKVKAFTLVELLVAIGVSAFILIAAYGVYIVGTKGFRQNTASAELTQNARISLERMSREIRQNVDILTELPLDPTAGAPPSEIKLQDGHNYWPGIGKIEYITYYLSGTDLHRKVSHYAFPALPNDWVLYSTQDANGNLPSEVTDLDQIKAENISQMQFWGDKVITINLSVSSGQNTYHFQTQALGRNIQ